MTYADAIKFLYGLNWFGARFGLETTRALAAAAGNPQNQLRFIHVAGTNGKGSTCAILESIYRAAGLRVGLFTSPHLVSFRERIQINRQLISETDVVRLVGELRGYLPAVPAATVTLFEFVTVMALRYFAEQKCDLVIWEAGLGGRLDATNIVTPLASVITNIGLDHQQWLGNTLAEIASEKAGIIKPGVPVLTATEQPEALAVIRAIAQRQNAPLTHINFPTDAQNLPEVSLLGDHQRQNAQLALATVRTLQPQLPVNGTAIRRGLQSVYWPGRLQLLSRGDQKFLIDGAHNLDGATALAATLKTRYPTATATLILGVLGDKDWRKICELLAPRAARILLVPVGSERTAQPAELAFACRTANPTAEVVCCGSLAESLDRTGRDAFVVITGSLYLVGEALAVLDLNFREVANERGLNEWTGVKK